jgi:hypothetical protein
MTLEQDIKIIDLPTEKGEFIVVQLFIDRKPVMLCGYTYHSEILGNYLRSKEIEPEKQTVRNILGEAEIPVLEGPRYKVVGMGRAKIDPRRKQFQLPYDASADYKITPDYAFREQLRKQFSDWNTRNPEF